MPRYAIEACRALVTLSAADQAAAIDWGVRNLKVPAERIAVRLLPETQPEQGAIPTDMSKNKNAAKAAPKPTLGDRVEKKATPKKAAKKQPASPDDMTRKVAARNVVRAAPKEGMSGLDAAADVLKRSKEPMSAKQIVACIQNDGLAPGMKGKTPHATIYAAMITEIDKKGKDSRFARGKDKGTFVHA